LERGNRRANDSDFLLAKNTVEQWYSEPARLEAGLLDQAWWRRHLERGTQPEVAAIKERHAEQMTALDAQSETFTSQDYLARVKAIADAQQAEIDQLLLQKTAALLRSQAEEAAPSGEPPVKRTRADLEFADPGAGPSHQERLLGWDQAHGQLALDFAEQGRQLAGRVRQAPQAIWLDTDGAEIRRTFYALSRYIGLRGPSDSHGPRLHDFRHRFAVETLIRWYRSGQDIERRLPILSTYLGHVHVADTYWYLTGSPELMGLAVKRFEDYWEKQS